MKEKEGDKEKYRKKPLPPEKKTFLKELEKSIKIAKKHSFKTFIDYLTQHPNIKALWTLPDVIYERTSWYLIELGTKGASLQRITEALTTTNDKFLNWIPEDSMEQITKERKEKRKRFIKEEKVYRNAVRLLSNGNILPSEMKTTLTAQVDKYLDSKAITELGEVCWRYCGCPNPVKFIKTKPITVTKKSPIWSNRIITLIDELIHCGFGKNQAYTKTAELLNLAYPHIFKEADPDIVRQRYNYHKNKPPVK